MHERGGLEGLARRFIGHADRGQLAQFLENQRQQFVRGSGVALLDGLQHLGDLVQGLSGGYTAWLQYATAKSRRILFDG